MCFTFAAPAAYAADSFGVSGFAAVYIQAEDTVSSGYTLNGTSVPSGSMLLEGDTYTVTEGIINALGAMPETLKDAHVWPNPCNAKKGCSSVTFSKITYSADLKIYTVSGELVWQESKADSASTMSWNLRNMRGTKVASGLYVYYIKTGNSTSKGKLIVIR